VRYRSALSRCAASVLAAVLTMAVMNQARATVTWSFFETGISCFTGPSCTLPPQPFVFATLTLPGPVSEGTALWRGFLTPPPVYTGDEFIFSVAFFRLSPAFNGDQGGSACGFSGGPMTICDFDISWSATASELAIRIFFDAINDNIGGHNIGEGGQAFGRFGGAVATDRERLGGCNILNGTCELTGFWQSDLVLPEPSSASLILAGLFGAWLTRRKLAKKAI
jgi:hypothetical protein